MKFILNEKLESMVIYLEYFDYISYVKANENRQRINI